MHQISSAEFSKNVREDNKKNIHNPSRKLEIMIPEKKRGRKKGGLTSNFYFKLFV